MRNTRLADKVKIVMAVAPTAGAAEAMTATEVDARGYGRVMFVMSTGAAGTGATVTPKIQNSATSEGSYADVTSAAFSQITAAAGASKQYALDIPVDGTRPYYKVVGTIGTQTLANSCVAVLYKGHTYPVATSWATQAITV